MRPALLPVQDVKCVTLSGCDRQSDPTHKSPLVTQWAYFEPLRFWRFRELTASYTLPEKVAATA